MAMGGGGGDDEVMSEINVTPLCDIFVVLLIIFMMTGDKITAKGPEVSLPAMEAEVKNDAQVSVTLLKDKSLYVNNLPVTDSTIVKALSDELGKPVYKNKHVIFRGDRGLLMEDVVKVMMLCHAGELAAGVQDVQISIGTTLKSKKK